MPVKHTPTGIVHKGTQGGTTGCGDDTKKHPTHWVNTFSAVTCKANGCKK